MALANIQQVAEKPVSVSLLGPVQGYLRPPMSSSCSSAAGVGLSSVYLTPLIVRDLVISLALSLTEAMGRAMSSDPVQICQKVFNYVDLYSNTHSKMAIIIILSFQDVNLQNLRFLQ